MAMRVQERKPAMTLWGLVAGDDPCSLTEALDRCEPATTEEGYVCEVVECLVDEDCDDGVGCNGVEPCSAQEYVRAGHESVRSYRRGRHLQRA